jgi:hypothetical protein
MGMAFASGAARQTESVDKATIRRMQQALTTIQRLAKYEPNWKESTLPPFGFALAQVCISREEHRALRRNRDQILHIVNSVLLPQEDA